MSTVDRYAATHALRPGAYAGTVRNIHAGEIARCEHKHRTRSAALACAAKLLGEIIATV